MPLTIQGFVNAVERLDVINKSLEKPGLRGGQRAILRNKAREFALIVCEGIEQLNGSSNIAKRAQKVLKNCTVGINPSMKARVNEKSSDILMEYLGNSAKPKRKKPAAAAPAPVANGNKAFTILGLGVAAVAIGSQYLGAFKSATFSMIPFFPSANGTANGTFAAANASAATNGTWAFVNSTLTSVARNASVNASRLFTSAVNVLPSTAAYPFTIGQTLTGVGLLLTGGVIAYKLYQAACATKPAQPAV